MPRSLNLKLEAGDWLAISEPLKLLGRKKKWTHIFSHFHPFPFQTHEICRLWQIMQAHTSCSLQLEFWLGTGGQPFGPVSNSCFSQGWWNLLGHGQLFKSAILRCSSSQKKHVSILHSSTFNLRIRPFFFFLCVWFHHLTEFLWVALVVKTGRLAGQSQCQRIGCDPGVPFFGDVKNCLVLWNKPSTSINYL